LNISNKTVLVFGAYGHTGRFVVAELHRRGWKTILSGRDAAKLNKVAAETRNPRHVSPRWKMMRRLTTQLQAPLLSSIVQSHLSIPPFQSSKQRFGLVFTISRWLRNRQLFWLSSNGSQVPLRRWESSSVPRWLSTVGWEIFWRRQPWETGPPRPRTWKFPAPFGQQNVVGFSLAETITISQHLRTPQIHGYMNEAPLTDIHNPDTPAPTAVDESGRSSQTFLMEVIARKGDAERRAVARGRDIYAVTAPIVVEATRRAVNGLTRTTGVVAAGEVFDARDFIRSLAPAHLSLEVQ
jgi:hypothetical protein